MHPPPSKQAHTFVRRRRASISRERRDRNSVSLDTCARRAASACRSNVGSILLLAFSSSSPSSSASPSPASDFGLPTGWEGGGVVPGGKKARARSRGRRMPWASTDVCASRAAWVVQPGVKVDRSVDGSAQREEEEGMPGRAMMGIFKNASLSPAPAPPAARSPSPPAP